jgi:hypothetical protein
VNLIWAGTGDGLIHRTTDGSKNWTDVTKQLKPWQKVSILDASHFDEHHLRGHQYSGWTICAHLSHAGWGASWTEITTAFPQTRTRTLCVNRREEAAVRGRCAGRASHSTMAITGVCA